MALARRLTVLSCAAGVFVVMGLSGALIPAIRRGCPGGQDIVTQVLGGTASVASQLAYEQADRFYHSGVSRKSETRPLPHALPLSRLVRRLQQTTVPVVHRHLEGEEAKEVLPWFVAAARLDPHQTEPWCVGTYWFCRQKQFREAERFITRGIAHNPRSYEVYLERGILYMRMGRLREALKDLTKADDLFPRNGDEFDRKTVRRYLNHVRGRLGVAPA